MVANVAEVTTHGPEASEVQRGLKHFSPGTKLWLVSPFWGYAGDRIEVLGRHRGARGLIRLVVERRHLTNFRVRGVYNARVLRELGSDWLDKDRAERIAEYWNRVSVMQSGVQYQTRRADIAERLAVVSEMTEPRTASRVVASSLQLLSRSDMAVGRVWRDEAEVESVRRLLDLIRGITADQDTDYLGHPDWPRIAEAARATVALLFTPPGSGALLD